MSHRCAGGAPNHHSASPLVPPFRKGGLGGICLAFLLAAPPLPAQESDAYDMTRLAERKEQFPAGEAALALGADVYRKRCAFCHGDEGAGDGGAAPYLEPRPRDFTLGLFKFRSTQTGELPTDEDLFRTISRGLPGTTMPAWGEPPFVLPEAERWAVVHYLKKISTEDFEDPDFNPYDYLVEIPSEVPECTPERTAEGEAIYSDESKGGCGKCHGVRGRGDGAEAGTQRDDWGDRIFPTDQSRPWTMRNGTSRRDLFRSFSTGLNGTPMPGFGETLSVEQRWAVVCYVESLMYHSESAGEVVLVARRTDGELPADPDDAFWQEQLVLDVPLAGQVVATPRLALPAIDLVSVRAAYNDDEMAFHFTWNDRFKNVTAPDEDRWVPELDEPGAFVTAREIWRRRGGAFRDRLEIQLPVKPSDGPDKPFLYMGSPSAPVHLWTWNADWNEDERTAEERGARGYGSGPESQPEESQALAGRAVYEDGQWRLVLKRWRRTEDVRGDTQFETDRLIPFAVHAWDGGNGEEGLLGSISSWYYVVLVGRTDPRGYGWALLGTVLTLALMAGCVRKAQAVASASEEPESSAKGETP